MDNNFYYGQPQQNFPLARVWRLVTLILVVAIPVITLVWLSGHGYVAIDVPNGIGNNNYTYRLHRQGDAGDTIFRSPQKSVKRLVASGVYETEVTQGSTSYLKIITVKGWLGHTTVTAQLASEKARTYVADNPGDCFNQVGSEFVSYDCTDLFSNATIHVAATADTPTYTEPNTTSPIGGSVEGLIHTPEGALLLTRQPVGAALGSDEAAPFYDQNIYTLDQNLNPADSAQLYALNGGDTTYTIQPYNNGFIVFDNSLQHIYYYASIHTITPQTITLPPPSNKNLGLATVDAHNSQIGALYATANNPANAENDAQSKATLVVNSNGHSKQLQFSKSYSKFLFCGTNKVCLLDSSNSLLDVYDISQAQPKFLYSLSKVVSLARGSAGLLAVRKDSILAFNPDTQDGSIEYSFGTYTYNYGGIQIVPQGFLLSITTPQNTTEALFINETMPNTDSIDKKIQALTGLEEVNSVSINNNHIFITPKGPTVYRADLGSYGPDPTIQQQIDNSIDKQIDKIGIDRQAYSITYLPPS